MAGQQSAAGVGKIMMWLAVVCATTLLLKKSHIIDMPPPSTPPKEMGLKVALPMTNKIPLRQTPYTLYSPGLLRPFSHPPIERLGADRQLCEERLRLKKNDSIYWLPGALVGTDSQGSPDNPKIG